MKLWLFVSVIVHLKPQSFVVQFYWLYDFLRIGFKILFGFTDKWAKSPGCWWMKPILSSDIIDYLTATLNDYMSPESVAGRIVDFIKALYGLYLLQNGEDNKFEGFFQMILEGVSKNTYHIFCMLS